MPLGVVFLEYDPPDRVVFSWDISPYWQLETDPSNTSEVEVRFVAESPGPDAPFSRAPQHRSTWTRLGGHPARVLRATLAGRCIWLGTRIC